MEREDLDAEESNTKIEKITYDEVKTQIGKLKNKMRRAAQ